MIGGKSVLAVITARGGSKGVIRKNIRKVGGKPLIAWTIEEAKKSKYIDRFILSTDDVDIAEVATAYGCEVPFIRPAELALDHTPGIDPVLHAIEQLPGYDYVVLLQPTSPLRLNSDIDECLEQCIHRGATTAVSVTLSDKTPYWMYHLDENFNMKPVIEKKQDFHRRQDIPQTYTLNGAIYVAEVTSLMHTKSFLADETFAYVMPRERSLDIDSEFDLLFLETILATHKSKALEEV